MMGVGGFGVPMATGRPEPFEAKDRSSSHAAFSNSAFSNSLWRIALLTAVGAIGFASRAEAVIYWPDSDLGFSQPVPQTILSPRRKQRVRRHRESRSQKTLKTVETPGKEATKPHGALVIAISINKQDMKIYDANGFFAETPISTGMRGHPTPMGVFSVIQKEKLHHSNIYSGAPMPYMQRITWSGIAIHAGVLPGHPASHGCIRMPMAFAVRMYGWTKLGARVVIVPDELAPTSFSHPLLATQKVVPQPIATDEPNTDAPAAVKADKASNAPAKPAASQASLELKPTVDRNDAAKSLIEASLASMPLREQARTENAVAVKSADASNAEMESAPAKPVPESVTTERAEIAVSNAKTVEAKSPEAGSGEIKSDITTTSAPDQKKDQGRLPGTGKAPAPKPDAATLAAAKHAGPIAVFISRKDSKLYVRQNFAPLFNVPVTIAPGDRPLGTHVFTAEVDKDNSNVLHWSVVSLPAPARYTERRDEDERASRRRKIAGAAEIKAPAPVPDSPTEALDRLTIPADTRARIAEVLSTGSSIIVSDQGIAGGETGEGTDFIVSLR